MVVNIDGGFLMRYVCHDRHSNFLTFASPWAFDVMSSIHTLLRGSEAAELVE
jgi:hypothetical protein